MGALFDVLTTNGATGRGNTFDLNLRSENDIPFSSIPFAGDGQELVHLNDGQTLRFDDTGGLGNTNIFDIAIQADGGHTTIDDGVMVEGLQMAGARMHLTVAGLANNVNAQGAHVFDFVIANTGVIDGFDAGQCVVKEGTINGTLANANLVDAALSHLRFNEGSFFQNANVSRASMVGVECAAGSHQEDLHIDGPNGRQFFTNFEQMRAAGINVVGHGSIALSREATDILAGTSQRIAAEHHAHTAIAPEVLAGLSSLDPTFSTDNPLIDGPAAQTAVLDGNALTEVQARKAEEALQSVS